VADFYLNKNPHGYFDACVKIPRGLNILSEQNNKIIKIHDIINYGEMKNVEKSWN